MNSSIVYGGGPDQISVFSVRFIKFTRVNRSADETLSLTQFCQEKEVLTFTQATVVAPIILITFLYLPTILYVTKISIQFYGWKNWMKSILNDPVYFLFPILTSMSFYGKPRLLKNDDEDRNEYVLEPYAEPLENLEDTGNVIDDDKEGGSESVRQMHFSVRQSNILYILFIFGFILCVGADVLHQFTRKKTKNFKHDFFSKP